MYCRLAHGLWYGPHFEMHGNEREHQTLKILRQVVKRLQPLWILTLLDRLQAPNLRAIEGNVLISNFDFELLLTSLWLFPILIIHMSSLEV